MTDQQPTSGGIASADWAALAGAPATPESLTALVGADPTGMTGAALVDAIVASEKALSLLAGTQMRLLTALAVPFVAGDPTRLAAALARKSCTTGDDDPDQVAHYITAAAASLAQAEVAAALRIPSRTAGIRLADADTMTGALAPTLHAMEQGTLDRAKARVIADHCQPLTPEQTRDLQDLVLPGAGDLTTSELRDAAGQAVIIVDPDGAEDRHQEAAARRDLLLQADPDGMATLKAHLPADGAVKIFQVTDLLATGTAGTPGDTRGVGARRVDALIDIADQLLTNGFVDLTDYLGEELPDHGTPTPRTHPATNTSSTSGGSTGSSTLDATGGTAVPENTSTAADAENTSTAADADADGATADGAAVASDTTGTTGTDIVDETEHATAATSGASAGAAGTDAPAPRPATRRGGNRVFTRQGRRPHLSVTIGLSTLARLDNLPGLLAGFGAIPAGLARSIAASAATINALITDPDTGVATAAGALTYRPTQELRDQIAALSNVCQFPSCRQPVWRCDMDHRDSFNHQHPDRGGATTPENTGPFCRRHHLMKHHTDWRIRIDPNRTVLEFTSPTGHTYRKQGRQAAPPRMWVSTAGTAIAERLDNIASPPSTLIRRHNIDRDTTKHETTDREGDGIRTDTAPTSHIEDLLAGILIRHQLNTTPIDINYDPETAWEPVDPDDPPPF